MLDDKAIERKLLLKRVYSRTKLLEMGKNLSVSYFDKFRNKWDIDYERAALEIGMNVSDEQLIDIFKTYEPRKWEVFRGQYYTFENGKLLLEGSGKIIHAAIVQIKRKYGKKSIPILRHIVSSGKSFSLKEIKRSIPENFDVLPILHELEELKVIIISYKSKKLQEWRILEETSPILQLELGHASGSIKQSTPTGAKEGMRIDPLSGERDLIAQMDLEIHKHLSDLIKNRLDETLRFGKTFSISQLANYLRELFGPLLYSDSLLTITQQYGLANVEIVHADGRTGMQTGWNLSLFGDPGTGKSFSTRDIILGKLDAKIPPHGIPGRNRYVGGITPARFIRVGQAYSGRVFNFIVPEFNDWFKYKGMVEPLKLALEHGIIKYETHREIIGPYRLDSFFSVNYNVAGFGRSYEVTVQDPNFNAIEDRMLCRLHRLTKQRFIEIAESQMRLALGEIDVEKDGSKIRDHLTLVYAIETNHPLVQKRFLMKPVMITSKAQEMLMKVRRAILEEIPGDTVRFSARLEDHAIRFACAASLLSYFQSSLDYIPVSDEALEYAMRLYVEEASVRSGDEFIPDVVLGKLNP